MGNISNILGHSFVQEKTYTDSPEVQLRNKIANSGITPPDEIILDGKLRRFSSGTKGSKHGGDKSGWYICFKDGVPAGKFGCWRAGIELNFIADIGRELTAAEEMANARRYAEARAIRDSELKKEHETASNTVLKIWTEGIHSTDSHEYLTRKNIKFNGARVTGDGRLMVPLYDVNGEISSIQYIGPDGDKKYHPGGATSNCFWYLGQNDNIIYVAEGFATAATIYEKTNQLTYIAYSASNLPNIVGILREKYGQFQDICVVADNDESGVGQKYADQASAKHGCRVITCPEKGDVNDFVQSGGDLVSLLNPNKESWLIHADEFSHQSNPISWLIKGWVQEQALMMVHGPSGGGKTFIVLDWCLNIASLSNNWFGQKVKNGSIVYLAGEGHHGLRARLAAWKQHNNVKKLNMWLSKEGCDLNTAEGYQRVVSNLRLLNILPKMIVVDTLHRFLNGDENSSQDTKTMLDACAKLIEEFKCSVLLVHHTGINEESQHRARGSSAWRGALDIEISVVPSKDGGPIEIIQRKSKDAELQQSLYCNLITILINGWLDEDGESVKSAVVEQSEASQNTKRSSKLNEYIKLISDAFKHCGEELRDEKCYFSRSALHEYLMKNKGHSERTAKNHLTPSRSNCMIHDLLLAEIIEPFEHGYLLKDEVINSNLLIRK